MTAGHPARKTKTNRPKIQPNMQLSLLQQMSHFLHLKTNYILPFFIVVIFIIQYIGSKEEEKIPKNIQFILPDIRYRYLSGHNEHLLTYVWDLDFGGAAFLLLERIVPIHANLKSRTMEYIYIYFKVIWIRIHFYSWIQIRTYPPESGSAFTLCS